MATGTFNNKYSIPYTNVLQLADAVGYAPDRHCVCTHQMAALFCVKWR